MYLDNFLLPMFIGFLYLIDRIKKKMCVFLGTNSSSEANDATTLCRLDQFDCGPNGCIDKESEYCNGTCIFKYNINDGYDDCVGGLDENIISNSL